MTYEGDCKEVLKTLPDQSVHCVVTSPPYFGLRQYFFDEAVIPRYDLTDEKKAWLQKELVKRGILPRQIGKV